MKAFVVAAALVATAACAPERRCGLRLCDVRDPACQKRAAEAAACLRGVSPVLVPVRVVSREEDTRADVTAPVAPDVVERWTRINAALSLLRLGDASVTYADAVAGSARLYGAYYSGDDKRITIIHDQESSFDGIYAVAQLVHEYVHALQDEAGHLAHDPTDRSLDRRLARSALVEGEASIVDDLATIALFGRDESDVPWDEVFSKSRAWAVESARRDRLPFHRAHRYFTYPFGSAYVHFARAGALSGPPVGSSTGTAPGAGFEAAWATPPTTAVEFMRPFGGTTAVADLDPVAELSLPARFVRVTGDRVGAFVFRVFLEELLGPEDEEAPAVANALVRDHLAIFHDSAGGGPLVSWRLRFVDAPSARRALDALARPYYAGALFWSVKIFEREIGLIVANGDISGVHPDSAEWRAAEPPAPPMPEPSPSTVRCPRKPRLFR